MAYYFPSTSYFIPSRVLMKKLFFYLHWIGLVMTIIMLFLSFLDPSRDEYVIHITASSMPLTLIWVVRNYFIESCRFFPFLF